MSNRRFVIIVLTILICFNLFPLYQMITSGGYLFYKNAFDETSYLQYDYSRESQGISRVSQYLVTMAHQAGLSGGWINFLFDIVFFLIFIIFARKVLIKLEIEEKKANLYTYFIVALTLLFGGLNPLIKDIFNLNLSTGLISWITVQEAWFMPLWRTPEPQFSLALMVVCIYFSLVWKSYIPAHSCHYVLAVTPHSKFAQISCKIDFRSEKGVALGGLCSPYLTKRLKSWQQIIGFILKDCPIAGKTGFMILT